MIKLVVLMNAISFGVKGIYVWQIMIPDGFKGSRLEDKVHFYLVLWDSMITGDAWDFL